jgi:SAM-dependent methyltransferase/uncharacterized protein YbaR (Trm112 family)
MAPRASALPGWILDLVRCPQEDCAGRLSAGPQRAGAGLVHCRRCGMAYPVLAGVPVLVPAPAHWVAAYRDAVIASLAEHGAATDGALAVIDGFAAAGHGAEPSRFGDDWIEAPAGAPPGAVGAALAALRAAAPPEAVLAELVPGPLGTVLDLGCGDGALAARLRRRCEQLVVADLSLRAVLRARRRAGAGTAALVVDADALPLAPRAFDAALAANLIDLVDDPAAMLDGLAAALRRSGRLALSTPEPGLGDPDDDPAVLRDLLAAAGLDLVDERDGVPWLRSHRPRYVQLYTCYVVLTRPSPKRKP